MNGKRRLRSSILAWTWYGAWVVSTLLLSPWCGSLQVVALTAVALWLLVAPLLLVLCRHGFASVRLGATRPRLVHPVLPALVVPLSAFVVACLVNDHASMAAAAVGLGLLVAVVPVALLKREPPCTSRASQVARPGTHPGSGMLRRYLLGKFLLVVILWALILARVGSAPGLQPEFDRQLWLEAGDMMTSSCPRQWMVSDLRRHHLKPGMEFEAIAELLGPPDAMAKDDWRYQLRGPAEVWPPAQWLILEMGESAHAGPAMLDRVTVRSGQSPR